MAIEVVEGSSAFSNTAVTTLACPLPAGVRAGDVLVAVASINASLTFTAPAGWTAIGTTGSTTNTRSGAWSRVVGVNEAAPTWTFSGSTQAVIALVAYRGADVSAPVNAQAQNTSTTARDAAGPDITTTADCWVVVSRTARDDTGSTANVIPMSDVTSGGPYTVKRAEGAFATASVTHGAAVLDSDGLVAAGALGGITLRVPTTTPTDSVNRTIGVKIAAGPLGPVEVTGLSPTFSASGIASNEGVLAVTAPSPTLDVQAGHLGGSLDATAPSPLLDVDGNVTDGFMSLDAPHPVLAMEGGSPVSGALDMVAPSPSVGLESRTRVFGDRVYRVQPESRVVKIKADAARRVRIPAESRSYRIR